MKRWGKKKREDAAVYRNLAAVAHKVLTLKSREQLLKGVLANSAALFGDLPEAHSFRESLQQTAGMLSDEAGPAVRPLADGRLGDHHRRPHSAVYRLRGGESTAEVTFSLALERVAADAARLRAHGYRVPAQMATVRPTSAILLCQRTAAVIDKAPRLHRASRVAHPAAVDLGRRWRKHWDYQLYKILEYAFGCWPSRRRRARKGTPSSTFPPKELARQQQELLFFEEEEAEHTRELARTDAADGETGNQQIVGVYRKQLKASIFGALNRFISFPAHFTAFVDWSLDRRLNPSTRQSSVSGGGGGGGEANLDSGINLMDSLSEGSSSLSTSGGSKRTLFHNIYYRNAARFHLLYQKAVEAESPATQSAKLHLFHQLFQLSHLEQYQHNLSLVKDLGGRFHRQYYALNEIACRQSRLVTESTLLRLFREQTTREMEAMEAVCRDAAEKMAAKPTSIDELMRPRPTGHETLPKTREALLVDSVTLKEKMHFYRSWSKDNNGGGNVSWLKTDSTRQLLKEFERSYAGRADLLNGYRESLEAKTLEQLKSTAAEAENFLKRWNNLSESLKRSPEVISDFQINCRQLMESVGQLSRGATYFGHLNRGHHKTAGDNVLLKTHLEGWRKTLSLLELCRGDFYQAAHWNALLSLLGLEEEVRSYEELTLAHIPPARNAPGAGELCPKRSIQSVPVHYQGGRTVMLIKDWSAVLNSSLTVSAGGHVEQELVEQVLLALDVDLQQCPEAPLPVRRKTSAGTFFNDVHFSRFSNDFQEVMRTVEQQHNGLHGPLGIEGWLKTLDSEITTTLRQFFKKNWLEIRTLYSSPALWAAVPSQLLSVFAWIDFTEKVEDAVRKRTLNELKTDYERAVIKLTRRVDGDEEDFGERLLKEMIKESGGNEIAPDINNSHYKNSTIQLLAKLKVKQVVLDVVHFINVIEKLSSSSTQRKKTFTSSQASFEGGKALPNVELQMGLASFEYTFQYLGALGEGKLVHTELTNKCFLTLTQAMDLGLGGNPFGPAGTGKTESVKALGQHFGRQVLVFNCDEAIDVRSMTRILVGLLQCGSWGCFDEFNRLQLDVLSVLSSQVVRIQRAIKGREATVRLEEYGEVALNASAALFITLNPAGKEYGGRNRIPDNLKSLFLPVAMTVPDSRAIVRFLLLAEGFSEQTAKALGEKVAVWFELASGSMSKQKHYDWGLRAIKACLEASGRRLHNYPSLVYVSEMAAKEMQLVVETLRQQIASKLVEEDVGKFDVLLEAAFGRQYLENKASSSRKRGETKKESKDGEDDEEEEKGENASFKLAVKKAAKELGLVIPGPYQMGKILQLHEQLQSRFGVVLIGPSGSGKTTIWKLLAKALDTASKKISTVVIGPKALVPKSKLFGYIDEDTREWHDGLFSSKARAILRSSDAGGTGTEGMTASSSAKTGRSSANSMVASSEKITPNTATSTMSWLIFDGDIDPDWVEALNSVLDDNRVLTLPSGERIDFDLGRTRILFETTSLANASPATISRLGVVSVDSTPEVLFQVVSGWSQSQLSNSKGGTAFEEIVQKSSKRNSSTSVITTVNTFLRTNASTMLSPLSTTRTLLEHLRFAAANGEDENTALDRMAGRTSGSVSGPSYGGRTVNGRRRSIAYADDVESIEQPRINNLVLTETMSRAVEMLRPLVQKVHDSNSSICLIGPSCSGKRTLVTEYLLTATATAHLVSIDCTPSTDALSLTRVLLASGTVLNGTLRPLATSSSSSSGSSADHFVVFVRHWELLQTDKWASNSLAALLVFIRRHGGFYHPDSFDWLTVERLQLIITSTEAASVDQRLLSSMHILQLNRPTTEEMAVVLAAKAAREISPKLISWFPRKYVQLLELLSRSASPASSQSEKADQQLLGNSKMKLGIDILRSFTHYEEHQLSEAAVDYELGRALKNYLSEGTSNSSSSSLLFTSINGGAVFTEVDLDRFKTMATKWLQQYARENDLPSSVGQQIEWLPQTVQLFAELCSFLAESAAFTGGGAAADLPGDQQQQSSSSFPLLEVQSLVVVGNRGLGRKTFARAVAHVFGYDKVWSPNGVTSERHLVAELKGLLSGDQVESGGGSSTADSTSAPLKILLLVDQIHLELLPYLQDRLYAMLYSSGADQNVSNNNSNSTAPNSHSISVRLIITTSQLTPTDHLLWLRNARLHRSEPLSEGDFSRLTETLLTGALSAEKRLLESTKPILPLFYRVYCHFAVRDHQITETNPSAAGATDSLNQEGENSSNEQQHIKANLHLYGNFLQAYGNLLQAKLSSLGGEGDRLALGVTKLDQVASQVAVLKEEALKQKALLADKRAEADDAFAMIMNSMHASEEKRSELEEVQAKIEVETKNLKGRKAAIDEELAAIEPLLGAAKAAVGGIQASSLAEIRSLRAPPEVIRDVLEGVLRLMGVKDTSWVSMKTFLSRKGITEILNFDCRKITPETLAKVEQLLSSRADSFVPANAKRASQAAASLAEWVSANVEYTRVLLKIDPLEKELAKLENGLVRATSRLKTLNLQLEGVDTEVEALRTRMQAVTVEAATIEINLEKSSKVLEASEKLVGSLSGEHKRWAAKLKEIEADRVQQPAKCLLTAAYVTAAASEPSVSRRAELLMNCLKSFFNGGDTLPSITTDFRPAEYLGFASEEEAFIRGCHPRHHHPVPIIVDPAHKALGYFGAMNAFETTRPSAKDWLKVVELSIRFGRTVVITDWRPEVLDIRLLPLMFGGAVHGGGGEENSSRLWALLGDRKVDYNPSFRLYLLTDSPLTSSSISSSSSTTSPAISLCRVINLSPSFGSISTALLRAILTVKRPELEVERAKVETEVTSLKGQLTGLENELLESLNSTDNSTGGSILENVALMEKLQFLKTSSAAIERSLAASDQLRADLEREQQQYAAVAQFAANLYFSLAGLQRLCSMYYFGYLEFETVFRRTVSKLHATDKSGQLTNDAICYSIYRHISRALFAEHRRALWHYFLATFSADISERTIGNGGASSGSETESIGEFITDCLKFNNTLQKTPKQQQSKTTTSEQNIEPSEVALIFTAPGSDPTTEIESAVQTVDNGQLRIISMGNEVLGQVAGLLQTAGNAGGGGQMADQFGGASRKSSTSSSNVVLCLANLHLVTGWLGHLGQLLSVSAAETGSSRPRSPFSLVVLITELNDHFPAALLERCTKFAYESVPGVRAHLKRLKVASAGLKPVQASITGANVIRPVSSTRTFEETTGSEQLFTLLEYFHAIVCERRFYQPFGWTKNYEFSFNEFRFARHLLAKLLGRKFINSSGRGASSTKEKQALLMDYIGGLFRDVIYGGKVDFVVDDTVLALILRRCFDPEEKFLIEQQKGSQATNEFTLLGLPLNADNKRVKTIDDRLRGHLQLLTAAASTTGSSFSSTSAKKNSTSSSSNNSAVNTTTTTTRFSVEYFQKLWRKILVKCKVSPSRAGERLFADEDDVDETEHQQQFGGINGANSSRRSSQTKVNTSSTTLSAVDYLHAANWRAFVGTFSRSQLDYAKTIMETIDFDLKESERKGLVNSSADNSSSFSTDLGAQLRLNQPPSSWASLWPDGPEAAQDYLITLARIYIKLKAVEAVFAGSSSSSLLSNSGKQQLTFDLTACFHPRLFLSALRQFAARQLATCVDQLRTVYVWNEGSTNAQSDSNSQQSSAANASPADPRRRRSSVTSAAGLIGSSSAEEDETTLRMKLKLGEGVKMTVATLSGVSLEGALFAGDRLQPASTDSPFSGLMPSVNVVFVEEDKKNQKEGGGKSSTITAVSVFSSLSATVPLPLYSNSRRQTLLSEHIDVPCPPSTEARWPEMGVALVLGNWPN
ncbi:Cytoplasmic dynein 2 heavy chain 1 [Tyrophagus putrescentiae]|nr:Cytoplasmic dynein 2 heavy chain 1 [Tyrophagus putrescentiae]